MKLRNCDRPRHKQFPEIRMLENPEEEFDIDANCPDVSEADYLINPSAYREVVWDIKVSCRNSANFHRQCPCHTNICC